GEEEEEEEEEELEPSRVPISPGDPPGTAPLAPVLQLLRNQLQEKDALIRHLEVSFKSTKEFGEGVLVCVCVWGGTASRGLSSGAQSFLAQQRLATVARRARTPHGRAPPS
uniref:Uncharacterized protein n=1 Tax=Cyanistes caeruleus TaxID=156563 RepID=A0A8C0U8P5_CYACU